MNCRLCHANDVSTIYTGPIRAGGADSGYEDGFAVNACTACDVAFLDPFPDGLDGYYETDRYWTKHHGQIDVARLRAKRGPDAERWLEEIGKGRLKGKRVADFGCGPGFFLDLVRDEASETIGVDPARHFQAHLESSGHRHVERAEQLDAGSIDAAVCFDTLEHMANPKDFVDSTARALVPGGLLCVGVPNQDDFLKELVPAYLPFFYHKSHLYYFSAEALVRLIERAGFVQCHVTFVHKYDLMNMIVWVRDGKGQGRQGCDLFDEVTEDCFREQLERQGIASHLMVMARKRTR